LVVAIDITDEELVTRYRGYAVDHDTKARYRGWLEHVMLLDRCGSCGVWHEPPGPICPACWSTDIVPTAIAGTGTIYLAIFLHQGPRIEGVDYSRPYPVVVVELDEQPGLRMSSTVVGASNEDIAIGRRVKLDWIERAGSPIPVFRLDPDAEVVS
jgi:uncharacterized OB-fold protein